MRMMMGKGKVTGNHWKFKQMTYMHVLYKYIKFVYIDTYVQIKYIIYKYVGHIYVHVYTESKRN